MARKDYYPTVSLQGTYYRQGVDWYIDGGEGIYAPDGWDIYGGRIVEFLGMGEERLMA